MDQLTPNGSNIIGVIHGNQKHINELAHYDNIIKTIKMTNNDIFKKLRVAHKLRDDDIVKILELVDFRISKSELNAMFRNEDHPKYMECGDQILRNFLNGLIIHLRGPMPKKDNSGNSKQKKSNI